MRYRKEGQSLSCKHQKLCDEEGYKTKRITETFLRQFSQKQWVIDAGSLQVMDKKFIPKNAILTPNRKEFQMLFNLKFQISNFKTKSQILNLVKQKAEEYLSLIHI